MVLERRPEPVDRIIRSRRDVIKRSPVIGDKVVSLQPLEESKGIGAGEMPLSESRFPPWSMSNREKGQIKTAAVRS